MSGHRLALGVALGSLAYALALQAPPPAGLLLAPLLAAVAAQPAGSPGAAALAGLLSGLAGFLLAAAAAGSLGGLWLITATGGVLPTVLAPAYHLVAPASLAAALRLARQPHVAWECSHHSLPHLSATIVAVLLFIAAGR